MTEDVHNEALRRYTEATAALQANLRRIIDATPPGHPAVGCLDWADAELDRIPYFYQRPNVELRRALWGPNRRPTPPPASTGCYEASFGWVHVKPDCHCHADQHTGQLITGYAQWPQHPQQHREARMPAPCPGPCNNAWRRAEQALADNGTEHDIPATWGQPIHCDRCTTRAHTQLAELPELVVAISLEATHGTAAKTTGTIGRTHIPAWPGQASRLLTDHIVGGMLELEDDLRELRHFRHRPGRGTEAGNVTGAVKFLTAHLDWALTQHPLAAEVHDRLSGNPAAQIGGWHRAAQRFTRRDARLEHHRIPCPRCELLTLFRSDGDDYIECRNINCQTLITPGEYLEHTRRLASECQVARAA